MTWAGLQPDKQRNRLRDIETGKYLGEKTCLRNKKAFLQIDAQADLLWTQRERGKQKMKNEKCSAVIQINKWQIDK